MAEEINDILKNIQSKLTIEGKKRIFEDGKELKYEDLKERQNPEEFTREFLIDKILFNILKTERTGPKNFDTTDGTPRMVDYAVKYEKTKILIEAKPINANLYDKSSNAAVNQIIGVFRLAEARDKFDFGIATDGVKWIFISVEGNSEEYDIRKDFIEIKKRVIGEEQILQKKMEDISKKFYQKYNDLIHGVKHISKEDCLVNSILHVDEEEDKEEIAQVVIDRLIFIKFVEAKGIINEHVLDYLYSLDDHDLNHKLNQLFFEVMNTKEKNRGSVDPHFEHIPYLNGSLFDKLDVEKRNSNYIIRARILHKVIEFLNKFKFVHHESLDNNGDYIDPEILGYIFERAMNATDRKGTGAYYTPKEITRYIAENTIYPSLIDKVNRFLIKEKGYKESETIKKIDELFVLRETTLNEVWNKIIINLSVCDNACGSGAFLLSAANVLFNLNKRINDNLGLRNSDVALKKIVLKSLYGVDSNSRAIEIALLRLWLWLVESYKPEHVEPLPNIEYNLRIGNSLIGYVDIEQFGTTKVSLDDFLDHDDTVKIMLIEYRSLKNKYVKATGDDARHIRKEINEIRRKIKQKLDKELYYDFSGKKIKISRTEFLDLKPFHWGFEFYEIFDLDKDKLERGFDVIIGNPPYGVSIKGSYRKIVTERIGKVPDYEIYYLFINRTRETLKKSGLFSYIIPNSILFNVFAAKYRLDFVNNWEILEILDCSNFQVFSEPTVRNMIFFVKKDKSTKKIGYRKTDSIDNFQDLINQKRKKAKYEDVLLFNQNWSLLFKLDKTTIDIISKIKKDSKDLISLCPNMSQGLIAYDKYRGQDPEIIKSRAYHFFEKTKPDLKKWLWGEDVRRYSVEWNGKEYIDYCEGIANPRQPFFFKDSRVLIREITNPSIYAAYIEKEAYNDPSIIIVHSKDSAYSLMTILGILNSKLATFFHFNYSPKAIKGAFPKILVQDIKQFPIKEKSEENKQNYSKLESLVKERLQSKNIDLDKKIDEIVYSIYGLNKKEIEIIEKNV
jgi:adenine-specific DNA-methyltransferase